MGNVLNSAYAILLRYGRYAEAELSQDVILRRFELQLTALVQGDPAASQLLRAQGQLK